MRGAGAWGRWSRLAVAVLALVCATAASRTVPARAQGWLPILGYQSDGSPTRLIAVDAPGLGAVAVDGINLRTAAGRVSGPTGADRRQLAAAHRAGLPAVLVLGNYSNRIGDFSERLAWRTLRSPGATGELAATLAADVRQDGWNGISVDLEALHARDGSGLAGLLADLRARLPAGDSLTVAIENLTSPRQYVPNGYELGRIASSVDQVVLMAYDEHGTWERTPGPVGADRWVRAGLRALLDAVPAEQVDLGVAGYGYIWRHSRASYVSDARARRIVRRAGARARWVASVGEWTARLPGGAVLWWSDRRSLDARMNLATSLHLHGLSVWSLGSSDPIRPALAHPPPRRAR